MCPFIMAWYCQISILIVLSWTVVQSFEMDQSKCDRKRVHGCTKSFGKYQNLTESIFPRISEQKLRNICSEYLVVDKCLEPMRDTCTIYEEYYYLGLDGSFGFLCEEENIQEYLQHSACLGDKSLRATGLKCRHDFYISFYMHHTEEKICGYVDTLLNCNKAAVQGKCGKDTANWQYQINVRHMSPVIKDFDCKLGSERMSDGIIAAIVIIVLVVIFGITSIVLWSCRGKIKERISKAKTQHIDHYSPQRDDVSRSHGSHNVDYPVTGYDQDVTDYRLEYRNDLGDPSAFEESTTGVINPGYMDGSPTRNNLEPKPTQTDSNTGDVATTNGLSSGAPLGAISADITLTLDPAVPTYDVLI